MAKIVIKDATNSVLWHLIFAPFVDPKVKEQAREELRERGCYGEAIEEVRE